MAQMKATDFETFDMEQYEAELDAIIAEVIPDEFDPSDA